MSKTTSAGYQAQAGVDHRTALLFEIALDSVDGGTQYYNNTGKTIVFDGQTYVPVGIQVDDFNINSDLEVPSTRLTINELDPNSTFIAQLLSSRVEFRSRMLTVKRVFLDALDDSSNYVVLFLGPINQVEMGPNQFIMEVRSHITGLGQRGPRGRTTSSCNWRFGDSDTCQIDGESAANKQTSTATGGSTTTLVDTARTEVDDYWNLGMILMTSGDNAGRSRGILNWDNATKTFLLDVEFDNAIQAGDTYVVRRGCDKTFYTCKNTFDNTINFGGFPYVPRQAIEV